MSYQLTMSSSAFYSMFFHSKRACLHLESSQHTQTPEKKKKKPYLDFSQHNESVSTYSQLLYTLSTNLLAQLQVAYVRFTLSFFKRKKKLFFKENKP